LSCKHISQEVREALKQEWVNDFRRGRGRGSSRGYGERAEKTDSWCDTIYAIEEFMNTDCWSKVTSCMTEVMTHAKRLKSRCPVLT